MTAPECFYGDPTCPCQDGDPCHYEGDDPMNVPPEYARRAIERQREMLGRCNICGGLVDLRTDVAKPTVKMGKHWK